ncbi:MAG: hypothetical protein LV480_03605 [Methylacidiphilales bacterium]|nr:hypothetical protein [Candidatus Methylacidiphilales bacterium]
MVAILSVDGNEKAAVGVGIRGHGFYSLRDFQKASVSRLVALRPAAGLSARRFAQLTPRDFSGGAGDRVANVAPWRVIATNSPLFNPPGHIGEMISQIPHGGRFHGDTMMSHTCISSIRFSRKR